MVAVAYLVSPDIWNDTDQKTTVPVHIVINKNYIAKYCLLSTVFQFLSFNSAGFAFIYIYISPVWKKTWSYHIHTYKSNYAKSRRRQDSFIFCIFTEPISWSFVLLRFFSFYEWRGLYAGHAAFGPLTSALSHVTWPTLILVFWAPTSNVGSSNRDQSRSLLHIIRCLTCISSASPSQHLQKEYERVDDG